MEEEIPDTQEKINDNEICEYLNNQLCFEDVNIYCKLDDGSSIIKAKKDDVGSTFLAININQDSSSAESVQEQKARVQKYCDILSECKNPNILNHLDTHLKQNFILIEFEGFYITLDEWNNNNVKNSMIEVVIANYAIQILEAMQYLHSQNYVLHRLNLKNILINLDNKIKLFQFGQSNLVKQCQQRDQETTDEFLKYINYPPESFTNKNSQIPSEYYETESTNVWDLGICLYRMAGASTKDLMMLQGNEMIFNKSLCLGEDFNSILKLIFNQNPNERPSVEDLIQKFKDLIGELETNEVAENIFKFVVDKEEMDDRFKLLLIQQSIQINSTEKKYYMEFARLLYFVKEYQELISILETVQSEFEGDDDMVYFLMGRAQYQLGMDDDNILMKFMKCLEINPSNEECEYEIANLYYEMGQFSESEEILLKLVENNYQQKNQLIFCKLGKVSLELKKYKQAFVYLMKYQELVPDNYQAYLNLGIYYNKIGDYDKAKENLEKSIELNGQATNPDAYYELGQIYHDDDPDKALEYYNQSLSEDPELEINYYQIGMIYVRQGKLQDAIDQFIKALDNQPDNIDYLHELGIAYYQIKDYEQAYIQFFNIIQIEPENKEGLYNTALVLQKLGKLRDAITYSSQLVTLFPDNIEYLQDLADLYRKNGQLGDALELFKQKLQRNPKDSISYEELGLIYYKYKKYEKSIESYENSLLYNNQKSSCFRNYANALSKVGRVKEAIENYQKCLELKPSDDLCAKNLIIVYYQNGLFVNVVEQFGEKGEPKFKDKEFLLYLSACYRKLNQEDKVRECFVKIQNSEEINFHKIASQFNKAKLQEEAVFYFKKDLEKNPNNDMSYMNLGNIYRKMKMFDESLAHLNKCIEINPNNFTCYMNLGVNFLEEKKYEQALEQFNKCLELNPLDGDCFYNYGVLYQAQKDWDLAINYYQKCLEINPKDKDCLKNLGNSYYSQKQYEEASKSYDEYLQLDPQNDTVLFYFANCQKKLSSYYTAINSYKKAIEINPNNHEYYMHLGKAYNKKNQYELAVENLLKCLQLDPNNSECYENLGLAYKKQKQINEAIKAYVKSIELEPNDNAYLNLGNAYLENNQMDECIQSYKKCLQINPNDALCQLNLGNAYLKLGLNNQAAQQYEICLQLDPNNEDAYFYLGLAYQRLSNFKKVLKVYEDLVNKKPEFEDLYLCQSGQIYQCFGEYKKAKELFKKSNKLNDDNSALINIGDSYLEQGMLSKARKYYSKSYSATVDLESKIRLINADYQNKDYDDIQVWIQQIVEQDHENKVNNIMKMNQNVITKQREKLKENEFSVNE